MSNGEITIIMKAYIQNWRKACLTLERTKQLDDEALSIGKPRVPRHQRMLANNLGELIVEVCTERHGGGDISSLMTFLAVSGVTDNGNSVVFDGSASFILPNSCAGVASVRKAKTGVQGRIPLRKMEYSSCGRGNLRIGRRRISVGGEPLERAEYQAE